MRKLNIKLKITLWYALFLLILLSFFSAGIYISIYRLLYTSNTDLLKADAAQVESILMFEGRIIRLAEPYKIVATNTYFIIFDANGNANLENEALPEITNLPIDDTKVQYINIKEQKWAVYDKALKKENTLYGWIRVSRSLNPMFITLKKLRLILISSVPAYILLSSLGGYFLADRALRPVDLITKTARRITGGDINSRINLPETKDEVGRLITTFNEMLDRISESFKKERRFASDASHELRTPIAIISAQAEQTLSSRRIPEEYMEAMGNILKESKKMSFIISQLLLLYRGDEGQYKLNVEKFNLNMTVEEIINEYKEIINKKNIKLTLDSSDKILIKADQTLVTRLFINLIDNALKYNKENGKINIGLSKDYGNDHSFIKILIEDNGIGIAEKDLPYIFDRFYQANKTRSISSTGLGLSIVKWIVDIHKGNINVKSSPGRGTKFFINLPAEGPD